ncbi:MAG: thiamine pyrophosphate-dependent enzyme [Pseudomonadota bacterium]
MKPRIGGHILVDGLKNYGVTTVFNVPGESFLAALDGFYMHSDSINLVTCRQEGGVTYMAEAYAKATGNPGVAFVTRGPGASNAMIGIHTAFQDSTPLLLFIGQVSRQDLGREAFQELDYNEVFGGVAKKTFSIERADQIPEVLREAWSAAISDRPGPVTISLPEDMLREESTVDDLPKPDFLEHQPDEEKFTHFAELLQHSKHPVLLSGGAGWSGEASKFLTEFSERQNIPVIASFRRQDTIDNHHPNFVGELGLKPNPKLVEYAQSADLFIAVGPRIGDITTSGYTVFPVPDFFPDSLNRRLVHIHVDNSELGRVYKPDIGIQSHPAAFLRKALDLPKRIHSTSADCIRLRREYEEFVAEPRNLSSSVRMDRITEWLRSVLPQDFIVASGAGNCSVWAQRGMQFRRYPSQLAPTNGSMGYGVPAGIAAKLAHRDRVVLSFNGDGCFQMNGQEIATAVQYRLGVIFLVINNNSLGTIRSHQEHHYPRHVVATDLLNPDFAALAVAYGAVGETVEKTDEFQAAFERAMAWCERESLPALIEVKIDY